MENSKKQEFPSFKYLLGKIALLHIDSAEEPTVITSGEKMNSKASVAISKETQSQDLERAFNLKWPNWTKAYEFLKCESKEEFQIRFDGILKMWAQWIPTAKISQPRYVPVECQAEYLAAMEEKREVNYKLFINPMCLNSKLAILSAKVDDGLFNIVYTLVDDQSCGLYKTTGITSDYIACCALVENESRGVVALAEELVFFELTLEPTCVNITHRVPNPTYIKLPENPTTDQEWQSKYPSLQVAMTDRFLVLARRGGMIHIIDTKTGKQLYKLKRSHVTSLYVDQTELSVGTNDGRIMRFQYFFEGEKLFLARAEKNIESFSKEYHLTKGETIKLPPQTVLCHITTPNRSIVALSEALICTNTHPAINIVAVNPKLHNVTNMALMGDLMFTLTDDYCLHITPLDEADPIRVAKLCEHEFPIGWGQSLIQLDPDTVRVLLFDGAVATFTIKN